MIAWKLTEKTCRFLANWNAKNLARITGRTIPRSTGTQRKRDLVKSVRNWRMKWVALAAMTSVQELPWPHPPKGRQLLARKMLMRMQKPYEEGPILLDASQHDTSMDELVESSRSRLARDKEEIQWQGTANAIYPA